MYIVQVAIISVSVETFDIYPLWDLTEEHITFSISQRKPRICIKSFKLPEHFLWERKINAYINLQSLNHDITSKRHGFLLLILQADNTIWKQIKVSEISGELVNLPPPPARPRRWISTAPCFVVLTDLEAENPDRFAAWRAAAVHAAIVSFCCESLPDWLSELLEMSRCEKKTMAKRPKYPFPVSSERTGPWLTWPKSELLTYTWFLREILQ